MIGVLTLFTLLSPWKEDRKNVSNYDLQQTVKQLLLKHFKDPRIPTNRSKGWRSVETSDLNIVYRWLIGETLEQFFTIIDSMALEHQWKYRRAFWKAYYDKGYLEDAWVVLGSDAKYEAKKLFGKDFSAGELIGGSQANHSVLILRIGNIVFAEWSHNGKCRAWKIDDELCPLIYQPSYYGIKLKQLSMKILSPYAQDGISHQQSGTYGWQTKLANFIFDETGVRISERDFWVKE